MQVTDETVELGCKAIADQRGYVWPDEFSDDEKKIGRENMRAALTAALSEKQAGEVSCIACEGRPSAGNNPCAVCGRSALVDVPAIEPVGDDLIGYVLRYGGMCRDCADMDGVCQSGQPCDTDQRRAVVKHTVAALAYGIKHGFIANPFASPPLSREGEDSAEVGRALEFVALWAWRDNPPAAARNLSDRERLSAIKYHPTIKAIAATRSGSATTQKGCAE